MSTAVMSRRSALRAAAGLLFLWRLTACGTVSTAGASARLIADALIATWWFIVAQVPGLVISEPTQAALTDAFRAIHFGGVELSTQMVADPANVEEFVKGVNVLIGVIVETSAIPMTFPGPTGDPISAILAAVVTLMPEVESSFHLSIAVASIERPQPGAAAAPPMLPRTASPTVLKAAEALLTRVAATKPLTGPAVAPSIGSNKGR
jgi:hypothetical protein